MNTEPNLFRSIVGIVLTLIVVVVIVMVLLNKKPISPPAIEDNTPLAVTPLPDNRPWKE